MRHEIVTIQYDGTEHYVCRVCHANTSSWSGKRFNTFYNGPCSPRRITIVESAQELVRNAPILVFKARKIYP